MRTAALATLLAAGVIVAPVGVAAAQPTTAGGAQQTIGLLEADGYNVVIDRVGSAPIDQCIVTSVRNPQEQTRLIRVDGPGNRDQVIRVVVRRTITVSLDCSR